MDYKLNQTDTKEKISVWEALLKVITRLKVTHNAKLFDGHMMSLVWSSMSHVI